jgi:hypothetical protein
MDRIADRAGVAAGWLLVVGVVVHLAPEAGREAKELASEIARSVRARFARRSSPPVTEELEREVREMRPAAVTR